MTRVLIMLEEKIDFVITWVDGNDEEWRKEKDKYSPHKSEDNRQIRYRDWGILKYWFRGIEKFAPWVNKIHFVTWGHVPEWLDIDHPKLNVVNHKDFIPNEYLPTFNSRAIELNLHRIEGLSQQFVYFNDDTFLLKPVKKEDFFRKGLPCDIFNLNTIPPTDSTYVSMLFNNMKIINSHFNKQEYIKKNFFKLFNLKYGLKLIRTLMLTPWREFTGIDNPHIATSYLKSSFEKVWLLEEDILKETSSHRFRNHSDVNPYLFRYWQLVTSNFVPTKSLGKLLVLDDNNSKIYNTVTKQKYKMLCINDATNIKKESLIREKLNYSFKTILPQTSNFEQN